MGDSMRGTRWEVIPPAGYRAHMHMALDEVLLDQVIIGRRPPTMRLWSWVEPALVIGSHQSVMNEIDQRAAKDLGFIITRRMSGGGTMLCEPDRTITYSLYLPASMVAGISFRKSYAYLDGWAVRAFAELGVPASYREINDIISPRGKIGGAAQARRRGFVLHHTTIAHTMDVELLPRLIRVGRDRLTEKGIRSAAKGVSPLSWFTDLSCAEIMERLHAHFGRELDADDAEITAEEQQAAESLVASKYATDAWINRLP